MKILVLDQASIVTGWAVFESGKLKRHGKVDLSKKKTASNPLIRYKRMCNAIQDLVDKEKPDWLIFEEVALQTNVATLHTLCQLQGSILQMCFERNIEHYVFSPSSWRKLLDFQQGKGIRRPQLKEQAKVYVEHKYEEQVSEDEADAICMGCAFIKLLTQKGA